MTSSFKYEGQRLADAKTASGTIQADSPSDAIARLAEEGIVTTAEPRPAGRVRSVLTSDVGAENKPPKLAEWTAVLRGIGTSVRAGIPAGEAIRLAARDLPDRSRSKLILTGVVADLDDGVDIAEAFAARRHLVGDQTAALVAAGAASGSLGETLNRLSTMEERRLTQRRQIVGAVSYPSAILGITILLAIGLLVTVIPTFSVVFEEFGIDLPLPTRITIAVGTFLRSVALILPAVPIAAWFGWRRFVSDPERRIQVDAAKLRAPLIGPVLHKSAISRVSDIMGIMDLAGVPMQQNLGYAAEGAGNTAVGHAVEQALQMMRDGADLSDAFRSLDPIIPPVFTSIVAQGAESAKTGELLENYAVRTAEEVEVRITALTELIQPLLMVVVMGITMGLSAAVYLPILEIYDAVAG